MCWPEFRAAALRGIDAFPVVVEVDVSFGLPVFALVGLPDASVRESRDRVRAAIRNSGFEFPGHRITVNLAPADVRKAGAAFDLPIALAILAASGVVPRHDSDAGGIVGELSLDGADAAHPRGAAGRRRAQRQGVGALLLPTGNARRGGRRSTALRVVPIATLGRGGGAASGNRPRSGRAPPPPVGAIAGYRTSRPTWPTCTGRPRRAAPSRSPPPAATTCSWSARRAPARPCSPAACRASCRR